jgi:subtilisin family serine protease
LIFPAAEGVKGSRAVAATAVNRRLASFSNFGGWIHLAAPGEGIVSSVPGATWGTWSGASMAATLAAGTAALVMAMSPHGGGRPRPRHWQPEEENVPAPTGCGNRAASKGDQCARLWSWAECGGSSAWSTIHPAALAVRRVPVPGCPAMRDSSVIATPHCPERTPP